MGKPVAAVHPDSASAQAFKTIAENLVQELERLG
jgi:MinD-like ATPase involved in chromosome partitioning or flagellar assembly